MTVVGDQVPDTTLSEEVNSATKWKRYLAYKESGIEWLNEIPAHWDVRELKWLANIAFSNVDKHKTEGEKSVYLCNYTDVYYNEYITDALEFMEATASPEEIRKFTLKAGDVIITKDSESWDDIAVPAYVPVNFHNVLCGYHLAIIRPNQETIDGEYLFRAFDSTGINDQFKVAITGITRYGLGQQSIKNALFPVPPLEEQRVIADFLNRETTRIDTLIAKKERLIELLLEKRTALISHVVTRGLNPDAPRRDSGVPWLGEVPAHWDVVPFKRVTSRVVVGIAEAATHAYVDQGVPIIRSTNVRENRIEMDDILFIDSGFADKNRSKYIKGGDIVTVRTGNAGVSAVVPNALDRSQCFTLLISTPRPQQSAHFYSYFLNSPSGRIAFEIEGWGTAQVNISVPILQNAPVFEPPFQEQLEIVAYIDRERKYIDKLIT